jgi:hypothetical protein
MQVYDVERDEMTEVTPAEARAGMVRYARSLGAGTSACAEWERRATAEEIAAVQDPDTGCQHHGRAARCFGRWDNCLPYEAVTLEAGTRLAEDLTPGDVFLGPGDVHVTVLRDKALDVARNGPLTGQACIRYWCRREDTGAEGYMTYGAGGVVRMAETVDEAAFRHDNERFGDQDSEPEWATPGYDPAEAKRA